MSSKKQIKNAYSKNNFYNLFKQYKYRYKIFYFIAKLYRIGIIMTASELKEIQRAIKFDAPSMAISIGIPYHTYRNYYYGANAIPADVAHRIIEVKHINEAYLQERYKPQGEYDKLLNQMYPHGIISEVSE